MDRYWFLPKGRKDVNESSQQGAEREGFEEVRNAPRHYQRLDLSVVASRCTTLTLHLQSGYRNRLLPIPLKTKQPLPYIVAEEPNSPNVVEPVWLQLVPQTPTSQYLLYWYVAETVPPDVEQSIEESEEKTRKAGETVKYSYPPPFPLDLKLKDRLAVETDNYEPVRHTGTSADSDEALYQPHLMLIDDAIRVLGGAKSVQADVVRLGWMAIQKRFELER